MFYVLDENNNKIEALDKEGVFAALEKAIADGSLADLVADSAFVTKLKCCVSGVTNKIGFITEAKLNELIAAGTVEKDTVYFITDDTSVDNINNNFVDIGNNLKSIESRLTALGFKEGSIDINTVFTQVSNVTLNEVKRQGNYVIGNFNADNITLNGQKSGEFSGISGYTAAIGVIGKDFAPKENRKIATSIGSEPIEITIATNGGIVASWYSSAITGAMPTGKIILNFGYEAEPIGG